MSRDLCEDAYDDGRRDGLESEHARIEALCRMLLDSGDITPMGVRVLTMNSREKRNG